ncbi:MAG TPA: chloride channel protein [Proteobacteria bacterium]|nr:chloride channel protein [Pseudomonadota bacterium]
MDLKIDKEQFVALGKWFLNYVLIGIIAGCGAIIFYFLCQVGLHYFLDFLAGYRPPHPAGEVPLFKEFTTPLRRWALLLVPALGGLISGWLVYTFAPEAEGHGTDAAIEAYHKKRGFIRARVPIIKTLASFMTLGTGGSGGREGPIAQIGAGFGSFLATRLKLSDRERRIMLAAGIAAGVGSIFRAPLAGALFAAEVLYKEAEFESEVLIPAGISSVVAYCVFCLVFGWGSLFSTHDFVFNDPRQLFPYSVLALILAGAAFLYVKIFYGIHDIFKRIKLPNYIKPAIGGFLTGCIGFFLPQTLAFGYGVIQMTLNNLVAIPVLVAVGLGKILTTSLSIGSGGSGGVFGPAMVIGASLGAAVGQVFHYLMPDIVQQPAAFAIVGMAGFFSAASKAPFSTIIMVSEMTGSYHLLLPALLVCTLAFIFSRKWTIYHKQVSSRIDSPAHTGDFITDVLEGITVQRLKDKVREVVTVQENVKFKDFLYTFSHAEQHYFPVVNSQNRLTGIFSINDIRHHLFEHDLDDLVIMKDVAWSEIITTHFSEDLNTVLRKFTVKNIDMLPIVKEDNPQELIGMLSRRDVIELYNKKISDIKKLKETG